MNINFANAIELWNSASREVYCAYDETLLKIRKSNKWILIARGNECGEKINFKHAAVFYLYSFDHLSLTIS